MKSRELPPIDADPRAVGERIRELRRRAHLSQGELASRLGMRQGPVCNLEQGKNLPSAQVLVRLASILNTTTDQILRPGSYTAAAQPAPAPAPDAAAVPALQPLLSVARNAKAPALYPVSPAARLDAREPLTADIEAVVRSYLALEDICQVPRQARIPLQLAFAPTAPGLARLGRPASHAARHRRRGGVRPARTL